MATGIAEPPKGDFASLKVGLCQVYTEPWDLEGNLQRTLAALREAANLGAELAVTPECVLQGYPDHDGAEAQEMLLASAETVDGPRVRQIRALARDLCMHVLLGFAELGRAQVIYNAAILIAADGRIMSHYRKVHLRPFEDARHTGCFSAGDRFTVAVLRLGDRCFRVGTMICFDREVTESVRCLRALGAELVLCPLATDTGPLGKCEDYADNEMVTRVRAFENELFIVVVNHAGSFNGGSYIVGPRGECVCQMDAQPGVRVVNVPVGMVPEAFHGNPLGWMGWGYRRPEVYGRYLWR
mgnify:CR=1 FL=1